MASNHVIQEVNGLSRFKPSVSFNLAFIPFSLHSRACFISVMIFLWRLLCLQIIPLCQQLGLEM